MRSPFLPKALCRFVVHVLLKRDHALCRLKSLPIKERSPKIFDKPNFGTDERLSSHPRATGGETIITVIGDVTELVCER
ncbi:MAG: hypothetical protein PUP92_33470 [Rhizonema sp. PD38]|nr:hypothetical protein [Rhizonema sp. PD38]